MLRTSEVAVLKEFRLGAIITKTCHLFRLHKRMLFVCCIIHLNNVCKGSV